MSLDSKSEIRVFTQFYEEHKTGWQYTEVHPILTKYIDRLIPPKENTDVRKILVPLCGKTKDIPYLLRLGYYVFGIEGVKTAILELDQENSLNLRYNETESIYHTEDMLIIFHGDFFDCPIEKWGPFDAVWDRAAFGTVAYFLSPKYIEVIRRGLKESEPFCYLLEVFEYDRTLHSHSPRAVTPAEVETYFGNWTSMEFLERYPVTQAYFTRHPELIGHECTQSAYFFKNIL